jgi:hypothetical protein
MMKARPGTIDRDPGQAIVQYISYALGGLGGDRDYASPTDLLATHPALASEAVTYCWANMRFIPQDDLDAFLPTVKGIKILSVAALDALYTRWSNRRDFAALRKSLNRSNRRRWISKAYRTMRFVG